MKILIVTQKIDLNDDLLGFFHEWVKEIANTNNVIVIANEVGQFDLPATTTVYSLGKERGRGKFHKFLLYQYLMIKNLKNIDVIFFHMCPIYVISAAWFRLLQKRGALWYAHGSANLGVKIAEKIVNLVLTSSSLGFRIKSNKVKIVGQGINTTHFAPLNQKGGAPSNYFQIITIGRIAPIKNYETLIKAIEILTKNKYSLKVDIFGGTSLSKDEGYLKHLKEMVLNKKLENTILFHHPVANKDINKLLQSANLFVSTSCTGSLDKAILEAMSCGLIVNCCNEAYKEVLNNYQDLLIFEKGNFVQLARNIEHIIKLDEGQKQFLEKEVRNIVVKYYSLESLIKKIINSLHEQIVQK